MLNPRHSGEVRRLNIESEPFAEIGRGRSLSLWRGANSEYRRWTLCGLCAAVQSIDVENRTCKDYLAEDLAEGTLFIDAGRKAFFDISRICFMGFVPQRYT